jgi:hypothetical protein
MVIPDLTQHLVKRGIQQEVKANAAQKSMHNAENQSVSTGEMNPSRIPGFAEHISISTFEIASPGSLHKELELFRKHLFPEPSEHIRYKVPRRLILSKYNRHIYKVVHSITGV